MAKPGGRGITRMVNSFGYSMAGLRAAWQHEEAFRIEGWMAVIMVPLAFWLGEGALERSLLIGSCGLVLIAEVCNSAIEAIVDRVGPEQHELSGRAKDLGSAAVFIALVTTLIIWTLIGVERIQ